MFNEYLKQIADKYKTGDSLEHTFRTGFEKMSGIIISAVIRFLTNGLKKEKNIIIF